jgi:hypothetical protein
MITPYSLTYILLVNIFKHLVYFKNILLITQQIWALFTDYLLFSIQHTLGSVFISLK